MLMTDDVVREVRSGCRQGWLRRGRVVWCNDPSANRWRPRALATRHFRHREHTWTDTISATIACPSGCGSHSLSSTFATCTSLGTTTEETGDTRVWASDTGMEDLQTDRPAAQGNRNRHL